MRVSGLLLIVIIFLATFTLSGCDKFNPCTSEEKESIVSPDKRTKAVYIVENCGATTSFSHLIYIVPIDNVADKNDPVFVADKINNLRIRWVGNKNLNISYGSARIFQFSNFWHTKELDNFKYIVEITETKK